MDADYLFTITDSLTNGSSADVSVLPYGRIIRYQKPIGTSVYVLHEGGIGFSDAGGLTEAKFAKLEDEKELKPELQGEAELPRMPVVTCEKTGHFVPRCVRLAATTPLARVERCS